MRSVCAVHLLIRARTQHPHRVRPRRDIIPRASAARRAAFPISPTPTSQRWQEAGPWRPAVRRIPSSPPPFPPSLTAVQIALLLRATVEIHRFPAFCGFTVGVSTALRPVFERLLGGSSRDQQVFASFLASSVAAAGGLQLLNSRQYKYTSAGRTIDMTLFAASKAADVLIGELWARLRARRTRAGTLTRLERFIGASIDPTLFAISSGIIMYVWVYTPEKLPPAYTKQIASMANADNRLLITLRKIKSGEYIYGRDTGQADILQSYCADLGLPLQWGDPAQNKTIPCELVHAGRTKHCEMHALREFWKATWKTAFPIYLTLNMLRFLKPRLPTARALVTALLAAARSASFLGAFVGLFWYGVCLTRTRLGPLFTENQIALDKICVKIGCLMCGWSVLVETRARQAEFMFFVLPRALAAVAPRRYDPRYQWVETTVFSLSAGVLMSCVRANPRRVRGMFGRLLGKVIRPVGQ